MTKRRRRRARKPRTYEQALRRRTMELSPGQTVEQQAAAYEAGHARYREISARVRDLIKEKGIPAREFIRYNSFAYKLGRCCRGGFSPSLIPDVAFVIAESEVRGLDRSVLLEVARVLFGITGLS